MATTDRYAKATAERKWNYIFLLHARYDGKYARMARAMGIPQAELKNWDVEFRKDVLQWIENNRVIRGDVVIDNEEIPTIDELMIDCRKRLKTSIGTSDDPSSIARTYRYLSELKMEDESSSETGKYKTVSDAVRERLIKK